MLTKTTKTLAKIGGIWVLCELSCDIGKAIMYRSFRKLDEDCANDMLELTHNEEALAKLPYLKRKRVKFISKLFYAFDEVDKP